MNKTKDDGVFKKLYAIDVSGKVEDKQGLSYLSWANAWAEAKKEYPNISYEIKKFGEKELPYIYDVNTGYMVFTEMTVGDITHEMWLPVMNHDNRAMKVEPYKLTFKSGTITVQPATMFDINKTIMRCLVKNLAMFGLGLYLYAGEDIPENKDGEFVPPPLTLERARDIKVTFGKYSGKTLGEIYDEDEGYVKWLSNKSTDAHIKKGADVVRNPEKAEKDEDEEKKEDKTDKFDSDMFKSRLRVVAQMTGKESSSLDDYIVSKLDGNELVESNAKEYHKILRKMEIKAIENEKKDSEKDNLENPDQDNLFEGKTTNPIKWGE